MDQKDLLEILATAAVVDVARGLRNRHVEAEEARSGQRIPVDAWPGIETFYVEAASLMNRRRKQIMQLLSQ